jgi:hypothetical protein
MYTWHAQSVDRLLEACVLVLQVASTHINLRSVGSLVKEGNGPGRSVAQERRSVCMALFCGPHHGQHDSLAMRRS